MTASRQAVIPIEHIIAEMAAFPLASEAAFRRGIVELDPRLSPNGATAALWREAERRVLSGFPGVSVDEAVAVRDRTWFRSNRDYESIPLHRYFADVARRYLHCEGSRARPWLRYVECDDARLEEFDDRRAWRWMSFAMPSDLLLAALRPEDPPTYIALVSPPVETLLREHGFAETHLHLGAALNFPTLWASACRQVGRNEMSAHDFASPGAESCEGLELGPWLIRGCLVRFLLGAFLKWGRHFRGSQDFRQFLANGLPEALAAHPSDLALPLRAALADLTRGELSADATFRQLQLAYRQLTVDESPSVPRRLSDVQLLDPLSRFYPQASYFRASTELLFSADAFCYLAQQPRDQLFSLLFWQVQRIRCLLFRHCIQRPLTPGLQYFIRFYERKSPATRLLQAVELESAARLCGLGRGLRSLEVRLSPRSDANQQIAELRELGETFQRLRAGASVEFGVVLHFLKSRGRPHDRGTPAAFDLGGHGDPLGGNTWRYRYSAYYLRLRAQTNAIASALRKCPEILDVLRGFDICRDESGVPTWLYAGLFERLVNAAEQAAHRRTDRIMQHPAARLTAHVGEDFVHLTSGLRAMHECLTHLKLRSGDRVGHGLALGVDPHAWAKKTNYVSMAREDRLFDLVWEHQMHAQYGMRVPPQRLASVEREIMRRVHQIFEQPLAAEFHSPHDVVRFFGMLYSEAELAAVGFPDGQIPRSFAKAMQPQLAHYLTSSTLFRRAREIEWIRTELEGDAVAELQGAVRRNYAEAGITIETNPVSNLLVGDLGDLTSHPLWRLSPPTDELQIGPPLSVCIGSDDPLPFVTNLPEEYQFLYDALILAGRSPAESRAWLDRARLAGLEGRFTLPEAPAM